MWREIRGKGLAYNYNLQLLPSEGLITLKLLRAAQLLEAYQETISMLVSETSLATEESLNTFFHYFVRVPGGRIDLLYLVSKF